MKLLLAPVFALVVLVTSALYAASDADVTIIKAAKVVIDENVITIVAEGENTDHLDPGEINGNLLVSMTGHGFPFSKGK